MHHLLTLITPLQQELHQYLTVLLNFSNPVFFSLLTAVIIFAVMFFAMRNSILPRQKKMLLEKQAAEVNNIRLMAMFAELDPDPVLRINSSGEIIFINPAAEKSGLGNIVGKPITDVFPSLKINCADFISLNKKMEFDFSFAGRYFSVHVKGISDLRIAQAYMHDISSLKEKEEELKGFSKYLQEKVEEERKRIARELHDDIGQKMVILKLSLQNDISKLTGSDESVELLRNSRLIEGISGDLRAMAHSLIPSALEETGLHSSIINLIDTFDIQSPVKGHVRFTGMKERLNINLEISIFRIIQEAVNNIIKYSGAKEYNIELAKKDKSLRLMISDDGAGFDLSDKIKHKGMGIRNMKERAEMHGGTFKIITSPGEGTVIMINFPLGE